jgi:hypothetical protein
VGLVKAAQYAHQEKFHPPILMHRNMNNHLLSSPVITIHGNSPIYTDGLPGIPNLELLMQYRPRREKASSQKTCTNLLHPFSTPASEHSYYIVFFDRLRRLNYCVIFLALMHGSLPRKESLWDPL